PLGSWATTRAKTANPDGPDRPAGLRGPSVPGEGAAGGGPGRGPGPGDAAFPAPCVGGAGGIPFLGGTVAEGGSGPSGDYRPDHQSVVRLRPSASHRGNQPYPCRRRECGRSRIGAPTVDDLPDDQWERFLQLRQELKRLRRDEQEALVQQWREAG